MSVSLTRGGYAPLESAGEYVCECLRDGDRVFPKWGNEACERVVRCRECKACDMADADWRGRYFCENFREYVDLGGFCAWGELKEG